MKKLLDAHKNALFALGKIKRKNEVYVGGENSMITDDVSKIKRKNEVYDYENDENQQKRENYGDRD